MLNAVALLAGSIPFLYAAWEFWRRIAFGQQFGTGDDPVVFSKPGDPLIVKEAQVKPKKIGRQGKITIGMDPDTNRGRQTLGIDALGFAYVLMFFAASGVIASAIAAYPEITKVVSS